MAYKKKGNNGGVRPGSGRKPRANFEARELFKMAFDKHFTEAEWEAIVLEYKGDKDMLRYMIDQRMGKASQGVELSGKDGGPIQISKVLDELDNL